MPTVSVCVPAYRAARFIERTVESVLSQTMNDLELIVVDDASPDATEELVSAFADPRIRLERNPANLGVAGNWNRSVELAEGRYVKVLCNDDILFPECLATQVELLESHPEVALVAGRRDIVDEGGRILLSRRGLSGLEGVVDATTAIRRTVRSGTNIFGEPVCVLMRKDLMRHCGPFSGARPYMIDLDYWCRMLRFGPLFAQQDVVGAFRVVETSLSVQLVRRQSLEAVRLFQELHDRDRQGVRRRDLATGAVRAVSLSLGRAAAYRVLGGVRRVRSP